MKQICTLSLVIALYLFCCEEPTSPSHDIKEGSYGSSVVKIPGLVLSKVAASKVTYTFKLIISGSNMKSMNFKWTLDGSGAMFTIDRIPAGPSRLFEGVLYGTDGSIYEGKVYSDIIGGKTAYISLVLRRTGSANVEVIIEDFEDDGMFAGCWGLKGQVNGMEMGKFTLQIPTDKNGKFNGYIKEMDQIIGKFGGTEYNGQIDGFLILPPPYNIHALLEIFMSLSGKKFEGKAYSLDDSSAIGSIIGYSIICDTASPPPNISKLVIFDSQGADKEAEPNTMIVKPPATGIDKLPAPPVKADYTFAGWYTEVNGIRVLFNEQFNVTHDITVYASWVKKNTSSFVVWSEGSGCDRELKFRALDKDLKLIGTNETAVKKGEGADFFVVISYDGVWIAFSRTIGRFKGKYGECDYHVYSKLDLYVAKIDNGKNLPANGIKVGHGYWPSWGDDANTPDAPKTLYFTHYESKTIKKMTINPNGTFTEPAVYHKFEQPMGTNAHIQMSPDGKFLLYRPGKMKVYSLELMKDISGDLGGQHPCWGPRSKYFIRSKNGVFYNTGTSVIALGAAGVGSYWQGISNDSYYDEGKLWIIARIGGSGQNNGAQIEYKEVDISNGGWKFGPGIKVSDEGTSCDIHIAK